MYYKLIAEVNNFPMQKQLHKQLMNFGMACGQTGPLAESRKEFPLDTCYEAAGGPEVQQSNSGINLNNELEGDTVKRRSSSRKYDRHDAGRSEDVSDDASASSSTENVTAKRKSRRIQPTDAQDYDGGVSDCSHCRKHRMAKSRRNRRKKSRSRSRRRRR